MAATIQNTSENRIVIIDVLRGFALLGVIFVNFSSFVNQQTPQIILNSSASKLDSILVAIIDIFFEWKFMTLFSILFGYGFGIIIERFDRKSLNPVPYFARRMFWLFALGMIHTLFWWGDILHLYAVSGIILLFFRRKSQLTILFSAIIFMMIIPVCISWLFRNHPETFNDGDIKLLYENYKHGNVIDIVKSNIYFYYKNFILSGNDLHDTTETLGRFLLGYFLLRIKLFESVEFKKNLFKTILLVSFPLMLSYFIFKLLTVEEIFNQQSLSFFLSLGIFSTMCSYSCIIVLLYTSFPKNRIFRALQLLGKMTLTNYLLISVFAIILLYGFGFGMLGEISIMAICISAIGLILTEIVFSFLWLRINNYGPIEWLWKQLTYRRKFKLRK